MPRIFPFKMRRKANTSRLERPLRRRGWQPRDQAGADVRAREAGKLLVEGAELLDLLLEDGGGEAGEGGVGGDVGLDEVAADVFAEALRHVFRRDSARGERAGDEGQPLLVEAVRDVFEAAPRGEHIDVFDEGGGLRAEVVEDVFVGEFIFGGARRRAEHAGGAAEARGRAGESLQKFGEVPARDGARTHVVEAVGIVVHKDGGGQLVQAAQGAHELVARRRKLTRPPRSVKLAERAVLAHTSRRSRWMSASRPTCAKASSSLIAAERSAAQLFGEGGEQAEARRDSPRFSSSCATTAGSGVEVDEGAEEGEVVGELAV